MGGESGTAVDHEALECALRSLGLFFGGRQSLIEAITGVTNEADVIRIYLKRERPHLLSCYDLEALVALVLDARATKQDLPLGVERFEPTQ